MSKVNQLIPTIRAQHQIHDLREIKWIQMVVSKAKIFQCSDDTSKLANGSQFASGNSDDRFRFGLTLWKKADWITSTTKYHQSWKLRFVNGLGWIWFRVAWPVLRTVQCCVCQAGHETLCAFPQSRYPYLSSPHRLPSKYFPWFPKKFAEVYVEITNLRCREGINQCVQKGLT